MFFLRASFCAVSSSSCTRASATEVNQRGQDTPHTSVRGATLRCSVASCASTSRPRASAACARNWSYARLAVIRPGAKGKTSHTPHMYLLIGFAFDVHWRGRKPEPGIEVQFVKSLIRRRERHWLF